MGERLTLTQAALLTVYAVGMAGGQVLFKLAALYSAASPRPLTALWSSPQFIAALALYAALAVVWVWILGFTPLSRAYPFVALSFVLTVLGGALLFGEIISMRLILGLALIGAGLVFVVT
jgi:drug/metabolite transporter (DMT)-like permease